VLADLKFTEIILLLTG